jgi:hypothetical protein
MTDRIPTHPLLYFSIKHSATDFVRPAVWNEQLGVGQHAQIVEVELQREYEGKGAYPNYIISGVIDGFPEMATKVGLKDIIKAPQLKGVWTWTRGGGWWGPYIHGNEQWIDLHVQVLMEWWNAEGALTEAAAFGKATSTLFPGCDVSSGCAAAFRNFSLAAAEVVLTGQWGVVAACGDWMRDDRLGSVSELGCLAGLQNDLDKWNAALGEKTSAQALAVANHNLLVQSILPHFTDTQMAEVVEVSSLYAVHLYTIVEAGWKLLQYAYRQSHKLEPAFPFTTPAELADGIVKYDAAFSAYRAYGLAEVYAPSLYHPYYLCLGTTCNSAFDPPAADQGINMHGVDSYGMGHTVDSLRLNMTVKSRVRSQIVKQIKAKELFH